MQHLRAELPPLARSVPLARQHLRELIATIPLAVEWAVDTASLALSEVVTNAIVHTGTPVVVEVWATEQGLRVEVADHSQHLPSQRHYALTSGTGRGLHILDRSVDRWGATPQTIGKVVWFEMGQPPLATAPATTGPAGRAAQADDAPVTVTLLNAPLLMAWAWQEHAQSLLREYLLFGLDDDPRVLERHAEASDALSLLREQIPIPKLPENASELLGNTLDPAVSAPSLPVLIGHASVSHFVTLANTLRQASEAAAQGLFLGPQTQPEIGELRDWLCEEVACQAAGSRAPRPWEPRTGNLEPLAEQSTLSTGTATSSPPTNPGWLPTDPSRRNPT